MANQQQLADLQRNVTQLQQLEQNILAQQSTPHNQQQQQLQVRVQQILQQKQQLQQQIKQFQQQVEQQLAYTQHAGPQLLPPPLQQGQAGGKKEAEPEFLEDSSAITSVSASDLNFLMCADQLQGFMASPGKLRVARQCSVLTSPLSLSGGVHAGIDPSLLTNAAFELVQASQALQAVQAVQPLLSSESPPMMTPLTQVGRPGTTDCIVVTSFQPSGSVSPVQHGPRLHSSSGPALSHPPGLRAPGESQSL